MAPVLPAGVPGTLSAGDTLTFTWSHADYPRSEGWSLSVTLAGASTLATETGEVTANGSGWTVTVPASRTTGLVPGTYRWSAIVTGAGAYAGQRYVAEQGYLTVAPNPATVSAGDLQPTAEKELALVEAALAGRLTDDMQQMTVRGRQVQFIPVKELLELRAQLKRAIWRLRHPGHAWPSVKVSWNGLR